MCFSGCWTRPASPAHPDGQPRSRAASWGRTINPEPRPRPHGPFSFLRGVGKTLWAPGGHPCPLLQHKLKQTPREAFSCTPGCWTIRLKHRPGEAPPKGSAVIEKHLPGKPRPREATPLRSPAPEKPRPQAHPGSSRSLTLMHLHQGHTQKDKSLQPLPSSPPNATRRASWISPVDVDEECGESAKIYLFNQTLPINTILTPGPGPTPDLLSCPCCLLPVIYDCT